MPLLTDLGVTTPVLAAPMAGGVSTPDLVLAAARAGGLGFLAGGYRTAAALAEQVEQIRSHGVPFGVNLFVPATVPVDPADFRAYRDALQPTADRFGITLAETVKEDDDEWDAKLAVLREHPVPLVSFTFGLPSREVVEDLQRRGARVAQTVTTPEEAAAADGVDALVVQSADAGGHSATWTPAAMDPPRPLPDLVAAIREQHPGTTIIAAGGIGSRDDVTAALGAGADAVMVGTLLLRTPESGASAVHKSALADPARTTTVLTHAFSGRPARGLRNSFTDAWSDRAPLGYPALHHLTSPLRKASAAAGDPEQVHLWAGTGFPTAQDTPAADVIAALAP